MFDLLGLTVQPGLVLIDIPFVSPFLFFVTELWLYLLIGNFVLGIIKRLPFL